MKSIMSAVVAAATLLFGSTAWAGEFVLAPNATYFINLDTADERLSIWRLDDLSGLSALRGRVTVGRLGNVGTRDPGDTVVREPGAMVVLENSSGTVAFMLFAWPESSALALGGRKGDVPGKAEAFRTRIDPGETFSLEIDWTPEGKVRVSVGAKAARALGGDGFERLDATMEGAPTSLKIISRFSEIQFEPLTLGAVR